jgi:hypothetical protein
VLREWLVYEVGGLGSSPGATVRGRSAREAEDHDPGLFSVQGCQRTDLLASRAVLVLHRPRDEPGQREEKGARDGEPTEQLAAPAGRLHKTR